jgi:hypothetical protein
MERFLERMAEIQSQGIADALPEIVQEIERINNNPSSTNRLSQFNIMRAALQEMLASLGSTQPALRRALESLLARLEMLAGGVPPRPTGNNIESEPESIQTANMTVESLELSNAAAATLAPLQQMQALNALATATAGGVQAAGLAAPATEPTTKQLVINFNEPLVGSAVVRDPMDADMLARRLYQEFNQTMRRDILKGVSADASVARNW